MLADRIRLALSRRPYWGAQTLADHLGTSPRVIRTVAARHRIDLMDRHDVERYVDSLMEVLSKLEEPSDGKKESIRASSTGQVSDTA